MSQRRELTWSDLRVGIFVLVGIIVVMLGILYVTGTSFLGPKYRLVTYLPEVEGLAIGAPVTLDGVQIGNVESIEVTRRVDETVPSPSRAVQVVMRISRDFQDYIRTDSRAELLTEGFLGNRVVTIQRGFTGMVLRNGQEVPGLEEKSMNEIMANGVDLMQNLDELSKQAASLVTDVQKGRGTLGALLTDRSIYNNANQAIERVDKMAEGIQNGQGTIGKLLTDDALYTKADSVTGRLDDVMSAVQDQKGTLGKIIYDPAIHDEAKQFISNSDGLVEGIRDGKGTLGKLATDDSFYTSYKQVGEHLAEATAQLDKNQSTAGKLFNDPQLYDNLTSLTGDLRLMVNDFRTNPKKFLHVKFSIF